MHRALIQSRRTPSQLCRNQIGFGKRFYPKVLASEWNQNDIPNKAAGVWIQYLIKMLQPKYVFLIRNLHTENPELGAIANEEKDTTTPKAILAASRRMVSKTVDSEVWKMGTKKFTPEEIEDHFRGSMKEDTLYITPFFLKYKNAHGIRLSNSAYVTIAHGNLDSRSGGEAIKLLQDQGDNIEVILHSTNVNLVPEVKYEEGIPVLKLATVEEKLKQIQDMQKARGEHTTAKW